MFAFGDGWDGTVVQVALPALASATRLALVEDTRAEIEFGIGEDGIETTIATPNGAVDVCRLQTANQAASFQDAMRLSGTHIEAADTYQEIWDSRFRYLALAPIKQISVVDRYAIMKHRLCPQAWLSGLERFTRLLDMAATGPRYLTVYSAWTGEIHGVDTGSIQASNTMRIALILESLLDSRCEKPDDGLQATYKMAPSKSSNRITRKELPCSLRCLYESMKSGDALIRFLDSLT